MYEKLYGRNQFAGYWQQESSDRIRVVELAPKVSPSKLFRKFLIQEGDPAMRWTPGGESSDIEDRRDDSGGGGGGFQFGGMHLGIGGGFFFFVICLVVETNFFAML